jgi:hypothetical protein
MPEEMTLEQEIDRIFAALGNAEMSRAGFPADRGGLDTEPEDQDPEGPTATPTTGLRTRPTAPNATRAGSPARVASRDADGKDRGDLPRDA